jgi:predicted ferric reductase
LYVAVGLIIVGWRVVRPLVVNARQGFRISGVVGEGPGVVSLHVTGRDLRELHADSGQFFLVRVLSREGWWRAHPFSLSASPESGVLRFTVKELGDHTHWMQGLRGGTRVFLEGPFGTFTDGRRTRRRVALLAGGIGITPLRALLDELRVDPRDITLLYRCQRSEDLVFMDELRWFVDRGTTIWTLVGTDVGDDRTDQLGIPAIARLVPDIAQRDVYVCGPPAMLAAVTRRLRRLGVPRAQLHSERFDF